MEVRTHKNSTTYTASLQKATARARVPSALRPRRNALAVTSKPAARRLTICVEGKWCSLNLVHHALQRISKAPTLALEPTTTPAA